MMKPYLIILSFACALVLNSNAYAKQEGGTPQAAYFTLEPDLTTNFYTKGKRLGYIQVRIDIMVSNQADLEIIELHQPLIRDTVIELLGKQSQDMITSLAGREDLRKTLIQQLNDILLPETGRTIIADLLFTKYIYQ